MSKRKIPSSNATKTHFPASPVSAPDLNLDILLHPNTTPPYLAAAAKKLRSSSDSPAQSTTMDARVPDRDFPDDDGNDSDSSSDIINTEIEPFPRSLNSIPAASSAFAFDILRKEGSIPTTHQLFPESAGPELNTPAAAPGQWLKLSEPEASPPAKQAVQPRKSRRGPRSRSSQYRGVTFYRRTGRWESHIWDCGKQVYLGGFDTAHAAARAYDRAAIKFRGVDADINFTLTDYDEDMKALKDLGKEEFVQVLRRQTTGFSRGNSKYRGGATVQKSVGQWEARMAQLLVNNKAYDDKATIGYSGTATPTNIQPRELDTNTSGRREDDLDLRLGISSSSSSPNSTAPNGKKVDKATTSSSRAAGPFGFQPLHGLPINIASNTLQTWPPPSPSPSTFDPEIKGSWAHHNQLITGVVVNSDGVPKWPASTSQQIAAASSGFLSSSSSNTNNVNRPSAYMAGGGGSSSSSSPNVGHFFQPSSNQYWYSHKREQ